MHGNKRVPHVYNDGVSPKEKASVLTAALLADLMFLERDWVPCSCVGDGLQINCLYCYCIGFVCPFQLCIPNLFKYFN